MERQYLLKRDKPDDRDFKLTVEKPITLPNLVDLRNTMPPIFDQLNLGSCTGNAGIAYREWLLKMATKSNDFILLSRLALYYEERSLEGTINQDAGASMREIAKALNKFGVCEESYCPYIVENFANPLSLQAIKNGLKYKIKYYHTINSTVQDAKYYLATSKKPILIGMEVFESFERIDSTGMMPMPQSNESCLGGHAVLCCGYDDNLKCFIVRNSWGESFGLNGYFMMPMEYVSSGHAFDFWVIG